MKQIYFKSLWGSLFKRGLDIRELRGQELAVLNKLNASVESYTYMHRDFYLEGIRNSASKIFLSPKGTCTDANFSKYSTEAYCNFIKENSDIIATVDGVQMALTVSVKDDPVATYNNTQFLHENGVHPIPVFRCGDNIDILKYYATNYSYIAITNFAKMGHHDGIIDYLNQLWVNHLYKPGLKVHALGLNSIPVMNRYPWYSADTDSWIKTATCGSIILPDGTCVPIGKESVLVYKDGQHFQNMAQVESEHVRSIVEKAGFDIDRMANHFESRAIFNIRSFLKLQPTFFTGEVKSGLVSQMELFEHDLPDE